MVSKTTLDPIDFLKMPDTIYNLEQHESEQNELTHDIVSDVSPKSVQISHNHWHTQSSC